MSFFAELKRRHVYRVAVLYIIVSWLVLQVADVFMSFLPLPEWTNNLIFLLLVLGFPVALVFAWAFELTPEGFRREAEVAMTGQVEEKNRKPRNTASRRKLDMLIFGAMVVALSYFAYTHDWKDEPDPVAAAEIRSIVVLPLDNLMNDPEQAFFVEGMHEALITELSKIKALRVISRTSSMHYKDAGKSVPEIASELGVDAIVEGSVLRSGNTVRITAQLIEGRSDRHLWADKFDHELSDILALYGEVTREIVNQIRVTVTPGEVARLAASRPVNPEVYELYLKGRYLCWNWNPREMQEGIRLLQQAVSLDRGHAPSHAELAICLQYAAFYEYISPQVAYPRAREAALMAVQIDDRLPEAHVAVASVNYYMEREIKLARQELDKALELDPSNIAALIHASWLLAETGHFDEALGPTLRAIELDPLSAAAHQAMGQVYYLHRDYQQAIEWFSKGLQLSGSDPSQHYSLAAPYEQKGQYEKAIGLHKSAVRFSDRAPMYLSGLGYAYGAAGMPDEAKLVLQEIQQSKQASSYQLAVIYLGLDEYERAIDWLEKAYDERNSQLIYILQDPKFDPLRDNGRFIRLLDRLDT